jgi:hypothetical protein
VPPFPSTAQTHAAHVQDHLTCHSPGVRAVSPEVNASLQQDAGGAAAMVQPQRGIVCCSSAGDVGSTAAAAVASALSATWQRASVHSPQPQMGSLSERRASSGAPGRHNQGSAAGALAAGGGGGVLGLPRRQRFEVAVQVGRQDNLHHLSDPQVRETVRRMTNVQVRAGTQHPWATFSLASDHAASAPVLAYYAP